MAKLTTAEFIEAIKELSVLELNELVKACEEEFGVSAAAGVVVAAAGAGEAAGKGFGGDGRSFLRLNVACPKATLMDGLERLKTGISAFVNSGR